MGALCGGFDLPLITSSLSSLCGSDIKSYTGSSLRNKAEGEVRY